MVFGNSSLLCARSGVMRFVIGSVACLAAAGFARSASAAPTLTVLHGFTGYPDGIEPLGKLSTDSSGALYGTTIGGGTVGGGYGTVFKLAPPAAGKTQWTKTILYAFTGKSDGRDPLGGVTLDKSGALYGTTSANGVGGTAFKLTPPAPGKTQWTYSLLYSFNHTIPNDVTNPRAGLIMDSAGALYGTTLDGIFKLTPPTAGKTVWTETVLYRFGGTGDGGNALAGLIMDSGGVVYGTTYLGGSSNLVASVIDFGGVF